VAVLEVVMLEEMQAAAALVHKVGTREAQIPNSSSNQTVAAVIQSLPRHPRTQVLLQQLAIVIITQIALLK